LKVTQPGQFSRRKSKDPGPASGPLGGLDFLGQNKRVVMVLFIEKARKNWAFAGGTQY